MTIADGVRHPDVTNKENAWTLYRRLILIVSMQIELRLTFNTLMQNVADNLGTIRIRVISEFQGCPQ